MKQIVDDAMARMKAAADLSEAEERALREIMVKALIDAAETTSKTCVEAAAAHDSVDQHAASEISDEIRRSQIALIANLQAMR
jgi:hypothetical protein